MEEQDHNKKVLKIYKEFTEGLLATPDQTEKLKVYKEFVEFFIKFVMVNKKGSINRLGLELQKQGLILTIIASDEVIEKYLFWRSLALGGDSEAESLLNAYAELLLAMRKDLNPETKCDVNTILDAMG